MDTDPTKTTLPLRLTAFPEGSGPYDRWELTAEETGEILLRGSMPVDEDKVRSACAEFHNRASTS